MTLGKKKAPSIQRLLKDIEAGKVGAIICIDLTRLSRDPDGIEGLAIKKTCKDHDVIVITPEKVYNFDEESSEPLTKS